MSRTFAVVNWIVAGLFSISAALQLNDPDPWRWFALYAAAAAACVLPRRAAWGRIVAMLVASVSLVWAGSLSGVLPDLRVGDLFKTMKAEEPVVELGREFLGLLIVFGWMVLLAVRGRAGYHSGDSRG